MGDERKRTGVVAVSESSIQISFTFKGINCRERLKLQPTSANLKRAEQHRSAILHAIERGSFDYGITFPDSLNRFKFAAEKGAGYPLENWLEKWLDDQKAHVKASTWDDYRKIVFNTLIPSLGTINLPDLKRSDVRDWCKEQTASNKRLANVQSVLRIAMQDALDDELIDINPMYGWTFERKEAPKPEDDVDPFGAEEQADILDACRDPQHRNLFKFAFWSGLRTSELVALDWGDIDWRRGFVRVSRALTQASADPETTKTRRGTRDVKLLQPALDSLIAQKVHSYLQGEAVFLNPRTGKRWEGDQPIRNSAWTHALKIGKVRYRRPYQTRHTYASMMLTAGESPIWLAAQMGHSDTTMIFRNYGRWIPDAVPEAGNKAVEMFAAIKPKKAVIKLR